MSTAMRLYIMKLVSWVLVTIIGLGIFMQKGILESFGDNEKKTTLLLVLFILGYGADMIALGVEKSKKWGFRRDERDAFIVAKAMSTGFLIMLAGMFAFTVSLHFKYESAGSLPVAWLWIMTFFLIALANVIVNALCLYNYRKQGY